MTRSRNDSGHTVSYLRTPLSNVQTELLTSTEPFEKSQNIVTGLRFVGHLEVCLLEQALNALLARHDVLRAVFERTTEAPVLLIHPEMLVSLELVELSARTTTEQQAEVAQIATETAKRTMLQDAQPLFQAQLLRLQEQEHLLLLTLHPLVADVRSVRVLVNELISLYDGGQQGNESALCTFAPQYKDVVQLHSDKTLNFVNYKNDSFWKAGLAQVPDRLTLPTDRQQASLGTRDRGRYTWAIPATLVDRMQRTKLIEPDDPYAALLAAWSGLIYRYTGQEEFFIGTSHIDPEFAETVGPLTNSRVLRLIMNDALTYREWVKQLQVRDELSEDYIGFHLNEHVQVKYDLCKSWDSLCLANGLQVDCSVYSSGQAQVELALEVLYTEQSGGLLCTIDYAAERFEASTIERIAGHLTRLLEAALDQPDLPLVGLNYLSASELHQLLVEWNDTHVSYEPKRLVHEWVTSVAKQTPDRIAVHSIDGTLTYGELNERANQLAHHLQHRYAVGPEVRVALLMKRSYLAIVGMLGVLKAGGAYVPLDPVHPDERIAFMIEDTAAPVVLTQQDLADRLPAQVQVIALDAVTAELQQEPIDDPVTTVRLENSAYLIYTSGSTGLPKGVQVEHRHLYHLLAYLQHRFELSAEDRISQLSGVGFDATMLEIWPALTNGAPLYIVDDETRLTPPKLQQHLLENGITFGFLPTPIGEALMALDWPQEAALRTLMVGGSHLHHYPRPGLPFEVLNVYGPTETTAIVMGVVLEQTTDLDKVPSIGLPFHNVRTYILDRHLQPVPIGVPGELHIGGDGVARGYLNRPELTEEKFIPEHFIDVPGARMYKTGDLVRYRTNGEIEFLGRIDQQVKIRGMRIELGEIETVMLEHEAVKEAVVIAKAGKAGDTQLVGYIVAQPGATVDAQELRAYMLKKLPDYMVPHVLVELEAFPLNANGKLNLRALPDPVVGTTDPDTFEPPVTATETVLAGLWSEVLGVEQVGRQDNFFSLGGHSLLGYRLVSAIRDAFGVELSLTKVFEVPLLQEMAQAIEQGGQEETLLPLVAGSLDGDLQLSFAQQRMWFLYQLEPELPLYNLPFAYRVQGVLDVEVLERSLNELIRRQASLRTVFPQVGREPVQRVLPEMTLKLEVVDASDVPSQERETHVLQQMQQAGNATFDLANGPLFRAHVYKLTDDEFYVLLCMHHIVADGWSLGIFLREWLALYGAFAEGQVPALPELTVQYPDFAKWQGEWLQGNTLERQIDYWQQQMAGAPALLELPTDHQRPAVQSYRGARRDFVLPRAMADRLVAQSKEAGVTLFMTLFAAWSVLLARYSRQEDLVIGSPIAGRTRQEIEGLIGFFVNTLALRVDLSGEPTFRDLCKRVRDVALGAYAHQDLPFEKLVEVLQPERNRSYSPLFQVMFALQEDQTDAMRAPHLQIDPLILETGTAKFDLYLELTNTEQGIVGMIEYATDLFDAATIERMESHLRVLLTAIAEQPDLPIAELPLLTDAERQQVLVEWNQTERDYRGDSTIAELFAEQVERTPDAVAVVFEDASLTYADLNKRANQLAHYLLKRGVAQETMVGLSMERSLDMIVALLAIVKAGGAYVPLDPTYPQERLRFMMEDANLPLVIVQEHLQAQLPAEGIRLIVMEDVQEALAAESVENPPCVANAESLTYVMYTSGSTGKPKGVLVPQRGVLRLVIHNDYVTFGPDEVFLQYAPVAFDASTFEIWGALLHGAKVVLFPARKASLEELARVLQEKQVTTLFLTTALFNQLVEHHIEGLSGLRQLLTGGEAMSLPHAQKVRELLPQLRFSNIYGPTENTTYSTVYSIDRVEAGTSVPIGRPIVNTQTYILDAKQHPVPIGVPGELYVGGAGLALGYWNRPDLTEEKFVRHPFSADPEARLYRTGDLVRYLPDGNIEFLGRIDNQVKIRGFRIELGEIEIALSTHPDVQEVVVLAREDVPGDKRLVAYVVPEKGATLTAKELRAFLSDRMPEYMIPTVYMVLDAMPMTANGKFDRRALPVPQITRGEGDSYSPPQTPTEELLVSLWSQVLRVEQVGREDDFFELGGHSLLATQLVSAIRETFEVELPLARLFDAPSVAKLAAVIDSMGRGLQVPAIVAGDISGDQPLSFAQQRLWFLYQMEKTSAQYNVPFLYRVTGTLDLDVLKRALQEIVNRHAALRTVFPQVGREPVQRVLPELAVAFDVVDLTHVPANERNNVVSAQMLDVAKMPFDLVTGPLFRTHVFQMSSDEFGLVFNMHHIVTDGWSFGVFLNELSALYEAFATGEASPIAKLSVQYPDYAKWQGAWLQGEALTKQVDYWREQLSGAPALLELPTDRTRPAVQTYRGARHGFTMPKELANKLLAHSRAEGVTLFMTLLSAWSVLLKRYSGQEEVVVGTPVAGRSRQEVEPLIGFFVNTLPMRVDMADEPTFRDLLKRVRDMALGAYAHQDLPFEKLVEVLQPERNRSYSPIFQVMFALNDDTSETLHLPNVQVEPQYVTTDTSKFDLTLELSNTEHGLVGTIEYSSDLFDQTTIERLEGHLRVLLNAVADNLDTPITELPLLTEAECQQLLVDWNQTEQDYRSDSTIAEVFAEHAERTPEKIALAYENGSMTYAELNKRANQMAHYLQKQGVGLGTVVGLCAERSPELIISLFAILKAGAVYLPLDANYPQDRLRYMIENSQIPFLVVQKHLLERLPGDGVQAIVLEDVQAEVALESVDNPPCPATAQSPAYLMYTSGSTGKPKGALNPHAGMLRLALNNRFAKLDAEETLLQFATIAFDASVFEIYGALLNGASLVLFPPHQASLEELVRVLKEHRVTTMFLTAALFHQLVDRHFDDLREMPHLHQLLSGGDVLSVPHLQKIREQLPHIHLVNGYGPTENSSFTTAYVIKDLVAGASVPIGRPISNTQVYILDPLGQPVPIGVPGELYAGGVGVAAGYWNRPDLTAEKFVPHPFSDDPHARLYRTGDLVRYLPDGNIEFCGRIDNQVKIRGFRIELGEVETALGQHPNVQEVVVMAREDVPGDKRLVAYVVPEANTTLTVKELRAFLKGSLPEFMVPSVFMVLEQMPVTPNGKVDRRALPIPQLLRSETEYVAPQTPTEELLANVWSQLLHVERIGSDDHFFDLGGHSLLATQLVSAIRETFEVEIPLASLFDVPTLSKLATVIDSQGRGLQAPPIVAEELAGDQPLSFAQQRLWFLHQMDKQSAVYNVPAAFRLHGELDVEALERSVAGLIARHASLRTVFPLIGNEPVQRVLPVMASKLRVQDATDLAAADRKAQVDAWLEAEARAPFDLENGPLVRVLLVKVDEQQHILLLNIHHIVTDGWSTNLLMRDLLAMYEAERSGATVALPELAVEYTHFSKWQYEWLQGDVLDTQLAYWQKQLSGAPKVLELPTDHTRPPVQSYRGTDLAFTLPKSLADRLQEMSRAEGVTLFMTLLSAWMILLQRYTNQEDIVVGAPIAGRNRSEVEGVVGFFVNTLALRVQMHDQPSFRDLLKRVREASLGAYAHQDLPFEKLVEAMQLERNLSYSPIFQVMFSLHQEEAYQTVGDLTIEPMAVDLGIAKFDLSLGISTTADGLKGNLYYNTDLFAAGTIERMIEHFQTVLESALELPEEPIAKLPVITESERHQLLVEWNATDVEYEQVHILHHLIEEQVERTPDRIAVTCEGKSLTYRELNSRANQLAHHLRKRGAGPDVRIGISAERSLEMMVGLLGILKSGSAYVPMDPTYPKDRLAYMLEDANVPVLLTQEHLLVILPEHGAEVICLDRDWATIANENEANPESNVTPDHLAYMIYTSGSTGKPKGAMNNHRGIANRLLWMQNEYQLTDADRVLQKTPFSFDVSVWELFLPLFTGAQLVMARPEGHKDAAYLVDLIRREEITTLHFVPSMLNIFLMDPNVSKCLSIRQVMCSGEALPYDLQERFFSLLPAELHNLYGPTEAAVDVTYWACQRNGNEKIVPIGRPVANTQIYILDKELQPVPIGVSGELHIGGVQVGRGYLNRDDLTAEKFIADPFSTKAGARLYKTGDAARFRADGTIEYMGRIDNQVKLRGLRIELGEIEAALTEHPAVRETVVLVKEIAPGDKRMLAYFVAATPDVPEASELKQFLGATLPDYMVPDLLIEIADMPLSPSGKADRKALLDLKVDMPTSKVEYVAPRNETEADLASMLAQLLRIETIGVHDNFFELGANSLLLARMAIEMREKWQIEFNVRVLFEAPTIADLAVRVAEGVSQQDAAPAIEFGEDIWNDSFDAFDSLDEENVELTDELLEGLSDEEVEALLKQLTEGNEADE